MQSPVPLLNVLTIPPGATDTQARIVIDGLRGAIFVYANGGPLGSLVGSWASTAGMDPYGNAYPQGLSVNLGVISGTTIEFPNGFINSNGFFLYSGTPAAGNLIGTFTFGSGTDSFGNNYLSGVTAYLIVGGVTYAMNLSLPNGQGFPGFSVVDINALPFAAPGVFAEGSSTATPSAFAVVASGQTTASDVSAYFSVLSQVQSSVAGGQMVAQCGLFQLDTAGNLSNFSNTNNNVAQYTGGPADGNRYEFGTVLNLGATNQLINSTSPIIINGGSTNVAAGPRYRIRYMCTLSATQAAGSAIFGFDGTATTSHVDGYGEFILPGGSNTNIAIFVATFTTIGSQTFTAVNQLLVFRCEIYVVFSAGGTLNLRAQEGTSGDTYTIKSCYSHAEIFLWLELELAYTTTRRESRSWH